MLTTSVQVGLYVLNQIPVLFVFRLEVWVPFLLFALFPAFYGPHWDLDPLLLVRSFTLLILISLLLHLDKAKSTLVFGWYKVGVFTSRVIVDLW